MGSAADKNFLDLILPQGILEYFLLTDFTCSTSEICIYLDTKMIICSRLGDFYQVNGKQLEEQYCDYLSDFHDWDQLPHANDWILFEENLGTHLSLDETALSQGELYTVITNKETKGRKGALAAMIK